MFIFYFCLPKTFVHLVHDNRLLPSLPGKFPECQCRCRKVDKNSKDQVITESQKQELAEAVKKELGITDRSALSKTRHRLTSSPDERESSHYAAYAAQGLLGAILLLIVCSDLPRLFRCPHCLAKEGRRAARGGRREEERKEREERRGRRRRVRVSAV